MITPLWVEALAMLIVGFMFIGIPLGYLIKRDYSKIFGIVIMSTSICCWIFAFYKVIAI